ncbi:unnamed protein product, partial [Ectocarpus fasciculatus]
MSLRGWIPSRAFAPSTACSVTMAASATDSCWLNPGRIVAGAVSSLLSLPLPPRGGPATVAADGAAAVVSDNAALAPLDPSPYPSPRTPSSAATAALAVASPAATPVPARRPQTVQAIVPPQLQALPAASFGTLSNCTWIRRSREAPVPRGA